MALWSMAALSWGLLSAQSLAVPLPGPIPGAAVMAADGPATAPLTPWISYCQDLAARLAAEARGHPRNGPKVADLLEAGLQQCAAGNIRGGLHQLHIAKAVLDGG
jgi:hypothetical protein